MTHAFDLMRRLLRHGYLLMVASPDFECYLWQSGAGYGDGFGSGFGSGFGDGYGDGYGFGDGDGKGSGEGDSGDDPGRGDAWHTCLT